MKSTKILIKSIITRLASALNDYSNTRLKLAHELYWARHVVNWELTEYGGWTAFCSQNINLSMPSITKYITAIILIKEYKYTEAECSEILKKVTWTDFIYGLVDLNRRIIVKSFIEKYKDSGRHNRPRKNKKHGDRTYIFSLPESDADKLDVYLTTFGMTQSEGRRNGVRDAMIKLINTKLS